MRSLLARFRDSLRRRKLAHEFDDEMKFHLEEMTAEFIRRGYSPEDARAAAQREFGNSTRARESLHEQAGFPTLDEVGKDLVFSWRGIRRRPGLALCVVVVLALGLGAAATIHGLIDAVFLRPLPVPHPEQLYAMTNDGSFPDRVSRGTVQRLEKLLPPYSVAAYSSSERCTVQFGSHPATAAKLRLVSGTFFATLGINPAVGRLIEPTDDEAGRPAHVAIVSHTWAEKNFGSAAAAVGRDISLNLTPMTIVGVLPPTFREISVGQLTDVWLPTALQPLVHFDGNSSTSTSDDNPAKPDWNEEERVSWLEILVRVRPGSVVPPTPALMRAWAVERDELKPGYSDPVEREKMLHRAWLFVAAPGGLSYFRDGFRTTGALLGGVVGVVLILMCTNISGLLLVRSMARHREIGIRLAIGAGSLRVVRLAMMEAMWLSLLGGAIGLVISWWSLPAAAKLLAPGRELQVGLSPAALAVMGALALAAAIGSSLAPAFWISRVQPLNALSGNRGLGRAPIRLGRMLVVMQLALAVTLVAVAYSLGQELDQLLTADPGFDRERVITATFDPSAAGYAETNRGALLERLRTAALGIPGVKSVGYSHSGILAGSQTHSGMFIRDPHALTRHRINQHDSVSAGFFGTVGTRLFAGRAFTSADSAKSQPVAIVNETFARQVFGNADPIGQRISFDPVPSEKDRTIVGIVGDIRINEIGKEPPALVYTPLRQEEDDAHFIAVRIEGPTAAILPALRQALAQVEPKLVLTNWKTMAERITDDLHDQIATSRLAVIIGGCAILLAAAGVAGSLGYLVILRQRELALRMAIGAAPGQLMRSVVADALRLGVFGSLLGLLAVWLVPLMPVVEAALHGRPGILPAIAATVVALVAAVLAGWIPARRAARIDPLLMLKAD